MQFIDLAHTIDDNITLFGANAPKPKIIPWQTHEQARASGNYVDCTCEISEIQFISSVGTYMDSPYHFHPDMGAIESLRLEQCVLPGVVVDCTHFQAQASIESDVLDGVDVLGKAVLFHTGWSQYWGQEMYRGHPYLSGSTAQALVERGAKLAGVDFLVIDDTRNPRRPVHVTLLRHEVLIIENLTNLAVLPGGEFVFHAAPVKFAGAPAFPVRAYAVISE